MDKAFAFLEKRLMGPLSKVANTRIIRALMNAGLATVPFTIVSSNVLPMDADRVAAHAHRTSPNTPVAMGIRDRVTNQWSTALGWWFANYQQAVLKAQSLGSVVYPS